MTPTARAPLTMNTNPRSAYRLRTASASALRARHHAVRMGDVDVHLVAALRAFAGSHTRHQFRPRARRLELNHLTQSWIIPLRLRLLFVTRSFVEPGERT